MSNKNIQQKMNKEEFHQYCKEFFCQEVIGTEMSFKEWVTALGNIEWELNTGLENPLFEINKKEN